MRSPCTADTSGAWAIVVLAAALLFGACGSEDLTTPEPGQIAVTTVTTGSLEDPDGYTVSLDGEPAGTISINGTLTLTTAGGDHTIVLEGLAANCAVQGDAIVAVSVESGEVTAVSFSVMCHETAGGITVVTATTGARLDEDGYAFSVDGGEPQPITINGSVGVTALPAGDHAVELSGLADNCTLAGDNPRTVAVVAGELAVATFEISCVETLGGLTVTIATTGTDIDPDGYTVRVDEEPEQPIGANASVTIPDLTPGRRVVTLGGVAANCLVQGDNPREVRVTIGEPVAVEFAVTCASGVQRWTRMESRTNADLPEVWGSSSSNVFVVGEEPIGDNFEVASVILRFDGNRWTRQERLDEIVLRGIWGSGAADVYAVGFDFFASAAKVLHFDGTRWSEIPGFTSDFEQFALQSIWGSGASDVWAVGSTFDGEFDRALIFHYDGAGWQQMPEPSPVSPVLFDVWGSSPTDVYAVGEDEVTPNGPGIILRYDGATWSPVHEEQGLALNSVWGSSASDVFAAGFRIEEVGDEFRVIGVILHYDGARWSPMSLPEAGVIHELWGTSASDVFAVGEDGLVLHYDGTTWTKTTPTNNTLLGVWGASSSDVFAVGNGGTIIRGTP